jgi:cytochrome c biogenesis protein CcmG/thiol:disulfide interchange protein DsbE
MLRRAAQALALAAVAGLLALLAWDMATKDDASGFTNQIKAGEKPLAPGFALRPLTGSGGKVDLAAYRGKAVVLNFWASWCNPCKAEAPRLEAAARRWADRGVVFIGVDANDFDSDGRRFLEKHGITYLNLSDGRGSTLGRWGVSGFPETFFIDRQGRAVDHVPLEIKADEIEAGIEKALDS